MARGGQQLHLPLLPPEPEEGHGQLNLSEASRGLCRALPRPCEFTTCRFHLDAREGYRTQRESRETCALDIADEGELKPVEIAYHVGKTRQRVEQILGKALRKAREAADELGVDLAELLVERPRHVLDVPEVPEEKLGVEDYVSLTLWERQLVASGAFDVLVADRGEVQRRLPTVAELRLCVRAFRARRRGGA